LEKFCEFLPPKKKKNIDLNIISLPWQARPTKENFGGPHN